MYAQLFLFTTGPGMRAEVEKMGDQFAAAHKSLKGFKSDLFLGDDEIGEYGSLTIWETTEDIESAMVVLRPGLEKALDGIAKGPPTRRVFEVYESKG